MMEKEYMIIDGIRCELNGEKNVLEVARNNGIDIPTFCYNPELSIYGACRMCVFENERGGMEASCSTPPKAGMEIKTNTAKIRKYRKMILELLLSAHCRDCTVCEQSQNCELQKFAKKYDLRDVRFPNSKSEPWVDDSSVSIRRDMNKCILCGQCVRVCNEIQNVGAIDFTQRGSEVVVTTAYNIPIAESNCVACGQCAAACPTGAITVKDDTEKVWKAIADKDTLVTVQVAPAVRAGLGQEFGIPQQENTMAKMAAAMKRMGVDYVFDTSTGADITVMEESNEFLERLKTNPEMPLFTSCCPAWINYCQKNYPEMMVNVSTCRSPMEMFAPVINDQFKDCGKKHVHVAIMPCTAKKFEAARDEFVKNGKHEVDYVLTTQELAKMIKQAGIDLKDMEPEAIDQPYGIMTGAGVIFGVTGGVTEAVVRRVAEDKSANTLRQISYTGIRGMEGSKEATIKVGDAELRIAVVSGLKNADELIKRIKNGEHYDFVEVMACPGGCVNGAGQPKAASINTRKERGQALYGADKMCDIKSSDENPIVAELYKTVFSDEHRRHEFLHVHYNNK